MSDQHSFTITAVAAQKHNPARCSVFLNGVFAFGCSMDLVLQYNLHKGKTISAALRQELLEREDMMKLKRRALDYATYKPRTAEQVRRKMIEKGYAAEEAEFAVAFLQEFGYLDDRQYARMFVRDLLARKAVGRRKLAEELARRGVSKFDVEDVLAEVFPQEEVSELAQRAAEKKLRNLASKPVDKRRPALMQYLQRQGFSWEVIEPLVRQLEQDGKL